MQLVFNFNAIYMLKVSKKVHKATKLNREKSVSTFEKQSMLHLKKEGLNLNPDLH